MPVSWNDIRNKAVNSRGWADETETEYQTFWDEFFDI
jgi:hypothetical protein